MLFNSYVFLFAFLPVVMAVYCLVRRFPSHAWTVAWLVLASLVYYAWWKPQFLLLLLASISVNAVLGKILCSGRFLGARGRAVLVAGLVFNLGLLAYFKYAAFFVENVNALSGAGFVVPQIVLPIGISFITFQKIAFLVDAYRGRVRDFSLPNFVLFVTFFPQLIAGPIVHHAEVIPQFAKGPSAGNLLADVSVGWSLFCMGLFKKVVVADACAVPADAGYSIVAAGNPIDPASAWITVLAYSFQLYYDFSGYSDMAVGLARLFGIHFPVNFHSPYKATGAIDFWRRWHITLSRFLRDYLYIPLGGNRLGPVRQLLNLLAVMLLGGLWHGANWTFVAWGALHGAYLGVNHGWTRLRVSTWRIFDSPPARLVSIAVTFLAVTLAWVPFRAENLGEAWQMLAALFPIGDGDPPVADSFVRLWQTQLLGLGDLVVLPDVSTWFPPSEKWPPVLPPDFVAGYQPVGLLIVAVALATFLLPNSNQIFGRFDPVLGLSDEERQHPLALRRLDWKVALVLSGMFIASILQLSRVSPFLYFQF